MSLHHRAPSPPPRRQQPPVYTSSGSHYSRDRPQRRPPRDQSIDSWLDESHDDAPAPRRPGPGPPATRAPVPVMPARDAVRLPPGLPRGIRDNSPPPGELAARGRQLTREPVQGRGRSRDVAAAPPAALDAMRGRTARPPPRREVDDGNETETTIVRDVNPVKVLPQPRKTLTEELWELKLSGSDVCSIAAPDKRHRYHVDDLDGRREQACCSVVFEMPDWDIKLTIYPKSDSSARKAAPGSIHRPRYSDLSRSGSDRMYTDYSRGRKSGVDVYVVPKPVKRCVKVVKYYKYYDTSEENI